MTATRIKTNDVDNPNVIDQAVYKLSEPLSYDDGEEHNIVTVSQANVPFGGAETFIFGTDPETLSVSNWLEMPGSRRGEITPDSLLKELGYEVTDG